MSKLPCKQPTRRTRNLKLRVPTVLAPSEAAGVLTRMEEGTTSVPAPLFYGTGMIYPHFLTLAAGATVGSLDALLTGVHQMSPASGTAQVSVGRHHVPYSSCTKIYA